jgi:hypothetical protein
MIVRVLRTVSLEGFTKILLISLGIIYQGTNIIFIIILFYYSRRSDEGERKKKSNSDIIITLWFERQSRRVCINLKI